MEHPALQDVLFAAVQTLTQSSSTMVHAEAGCELGQATHAVPRFICKTAHSSAMAKVIPGQVYQKGPLHAQKLGLHLTKW